MLIEFDWDDANVEHIACHDVRPAEAEEVYRGESLDLGSRSENGELRITHLGPTDAGRLLIVVVTIRNGKVRVVTSYPADRRYRRFYGRAMGRFL